MAQLILDFASGDGLVQLEKTLFRVSSEQEFVAVRGKTAGAYKCTGSFQWTPAVKAVCVLFLRAISRRVNTVSDIAPTISGTRGSLAATLDYAIAKEPQWLCDMFGLDESGKTNLRRLVFRTNSGSKRPGPVSLSLNESALPPANIQVLVNSMPVTDTAFLNGLIDSLSGDNAPVAEAPEVVYVEQRLFQPATAQVPMTA